MKKVLIGIVFLVVALGVAIVIAANSSFVLKIAADKFAPAYGIGYQDIKGNILTGVQITEPSYQGVMVARSVLLRWDPLGLLAKRIIVKDLEITEIDIEAINHISMAATQTSDANKTKNDANQSAFSLGVMVSKASITLKPTHFDDTLVKSAGIWIEDLIYANQTVDVSKLSVNLKTDIAEGKLKGKITHSRLEGSLLLTPEALLFERYELPLRHEALNKVDIKLDADMKHIRAWLKLDANSLLKLEDNPFTIDIKDGLVDAYYGIDEEKLMVNTRCAVATPYTAEINVTGVLTYGKTLEYNATLHTADVMPDENNFTKIADDLDIRLKGGMEGLDADITAENLAGKIHSTGYRRYVIHLDTPQKISLFEVVKLPEALQESRVRASVDMTYQTDKNASNIAKIALESNIVNVDANASLDGNMTLKAVAALPEGSLLTNLDKKIRWENLFPLHFDALMEPETVKMVLGREKMDIKANYHLPTGLLDGNAQIEDQSVQFSVAENNTTVKLDIASLEKLFKTADHYYPIGVVPLVQGSLKTEAKIDKSGKINIALSSPQIRYESADKKVQTVDNIDLKAQINDGNITLERYGFVLLGTKVYAGKPSHIALKDDLVSVSPLWVNDTLKIEGEYKLKTLQGKIVAAAKQFPVSHEYANSSLDIDLKAQMDGNSTSIEGTLWLGKTDIFYDINQKQFASDSDIVIVQEMKKEEPSPFMENLSLGVQIKSAVPLVYRQGAFDITSNVYLSVYKTAKEPLMVLGSIELAQGSSYMFRNKRFVLEKSYIYFTGRADKPLLEIKAKYKALNHLVSLVISGSPNAPIINFSSVPKLTREQILAILLFDSEEAAGSHSGDDMMRMMGGVMAKSVLADIGIKIEHLAIGADNSIEVGKKLSDELTIIYINGVIPVVKLNYRHSQHLESVIGASQESTSYDIIFKKDYEKLPISF